MIKGGRTTTMIKKNILRPIPNMPGIRAQVDDPSVYKLNSMAEMIKDLNEKKYGLPIQVSLDEVKSGGMFNSTTEDCIVITNKNFEKDYYKFVVIMRTTGKVLIVEPYYFGISSMALKMDMAEQRSHSIKGSLFNAIAGPNQTKWQEETDYYGLVQTLLQEVFS